MYLVTKIKLDKRQEPYWSCMLMDGENCIAETTAPTTFNMDLNRQFRETFENVMVAMMKILTDQPDQKTVRRLLMQDDFIPANRPKDRV